MLFVQGMSSCAVQEIAMIGGCGTAEMVMHHFCRKTLGMNVVEIAANKGYGLSVSDIDKGKVDYDTPNKGGYAEGLGENYVFHGVEPEKTPGYGENFAKFIEDNKLGTVARGQKVINLRYHPDHKTQVFIFNPDREAVTGWWKERIAAGFNSSGLKKPVDAKEIK